MYFDFANVLVFALLAAGFVVGNLFLAKVILRPKSSSQGDKLETYECGEPTVGSAWIRFDIRFYTVALMFVVFDVEVALLFPWGVIFREVTVQGFGVLAFVEALTFILILMAGLAYVWARGDIEWTPEVGDQPNTTTVSRRPPLTKRQEAEAVAASETGGERV